jgi:ribonuclease-3
MRIRGKTKGIEELLGVRFRDKDLLNQALTHRSYAHEQSLDQEDTNERLEFLGDAVLDLVVSEHLYRRYGELNEGELTRIRSSLVNMNTLADTAREWGLGSHILLSREERADRGEEKTSILADTIEALIGAVYLDRGLKAARKTVLRLFGDKIEEAAAGGLDYDFKSRLQELAVKKYGVLPKYRLREEGPDHRKVFFATVYVAGKKLGRGKGGSKKEAEQAAAREALKARTGWPSGEGGKGKGG